MQGRFILSSLSTLLLLLTLSFSVDARRPPPPELELEKEGVHYVAFGANMNMFRSVTLVSVSDIGMNSDGELTENVVSTETGLKADTFGASLIWGTYVTDHIKTELRYGQGIISETLNEIAEINVNSWFNWYIGAAYPVTDYANVYVQYGVSVFDADFKKFEVERFIEANANTLELARTVIVQPSRLEMDEDLFGTNFSTSWLLGADFAIAEDWYLTFEYGRLLTDADSGITVNQLNTLLKYEF